MSKEAKTMMGIPIETDYLRYENLPTQVLQGRNMHMTKVCLWNVGDSCMAGTDYEATGSGTRICP